VKLSRDRSNDKTDETCSCFWFPGNSNDQSCELKVEERREAVRVTDFYVISVPLQFRALQVAKTIVTLSAPYSVDISNSEYLFQSVKMGFM
jgi:hypothetical protein